MAISAGLEQPRVEGILALAANNNSTGSGPGFDIYGFLTVTGIVGAFIVAAVAVIYSRSTAKESKRLSDVTEKALGLQRDELELHKKELAERDRLFLLRSGGGTIDR